MTRGKESRMIRDEFQCTSILQEFIDQMDASVAFDSAEARLRQLTK